MRSAGERWLWLSIVAVAGLCLSAWGQQASDASGERSSPPPPPGMIVAEPADSPVEPEHMTPDTSPLTGVERLGLGTPMGQRSFLLPSFRISEMVDSNAAQVAGSSQVQEVTNISGSLGFQRLWNKGQLNAHYDGGGTIDRNQSDLNSTFHSFGVLQRFHFRTWSLLMTDELSYTPESAFGYAPLANASSSQVLPTLTPNQSILNGHTSRISNTVVGEVDHVLSRRSSVTIAGSYGILRFSGAGLGDSTQYGFQAGYNYQLTRRDTLGVSYGLGLFRHAGQAPGVNSHSWSLSYARRVTGALALTVTGGAQIATRNDPTARSPHSTGWNLQNTVSYRLGRSMLNGGYFHSVTGGAGVLPGASTHQLQFSASRRLTRTVAGSITGGYSHNSTLQFAGSTGPVPTFDAEFAGFSLSRPLGHQASAYLNYTLQRQTGNAVVCAANQTCGQNLLRHVAGVGFEWHARPLLLR